MRFNLHSFLFILLIISWQVSAGRPFITDGAAVVEQGTFELESGMDYWREKLSADFEVKHGITDRMDLGIGLGFTQSPSAKRGFGEAEVGLKFMFAPDFLALSATGSFGDNTFGITGILSRSFNLISVDLNVGMQAITGTNQADLLYSALLYVEIQRFCFGAETGGTHEEISFWQVGGSFAISDWLSIDSGLKGDYSGTDALSLSSGLTFSFPVRDSGSD